MCKFKMEVYKYYTCLGSESKATAFLRLPGHAVLAECLVWAPVCVCVCVCVCGCVCVCVHACISFAFCPYLLNGPSGSLAERLPSRLDARRAGCSAGASAVGAALPRNPEAEEASRVTMAAGVVRSVLL